MGKILFFILFPILILFISYLYFFKRLPIDQSLFSKTLFTVEQLSQYNGENDSKIYLSIVGHIFDVSDGKRHYGPGGSYQFFSAKDASRAYSTGQFTPEHLIPNISDLSPEQINEINNWLTFFQGKYPEIGKLIGYFFNEEGLPTENYQEFEAKLKGSSLEKEREKEFYIKYAKCNSEWSIDKGGRVWCDVETSKAGGVDRGWIGVPRKYYKKPGSKNFECICVKLEEAIEKPGIFKQYDNCEVSSPTCKY